MEIPISSQGNEALAEPTVSEASVPEPSQPQDPQGCPVELTDSDVQNSGLAAAPQQTESRPLSAAMPPATSPLTQRTASVASPRDSPVAHKPQPPCTPTVASGLHRNLQRSSGRGSAAGGSLFSPSETSATLSPPHSWAAGTVPSLSGTPHRRPAKPLSPGRVRSSRTSRGFSQPHFPAHARPQDVPLAMMSSPSRRSTTPFCVTRHGQGISNPSFPASSTMALAAPAGPGSHVRQPQSAPGGFFVAAPSLLPLMPHAFSTEHVSQQQRMNGDSSNLLRSASCSTLVHPVQPGMWGLLPQGSS